MFGHIARLLVFARDDEPRKASSASGEAVSTALSLSSLIHHDTHTHTHT